MSNYLCPNCPRLIFPSNRKLKEHRWAAHRAEVITACFAAKATVIVEPEPNLAQVFADYFALDHEPAVFDPKKTAVFIIPR